MGCSTDSNPISIIATAASPTLYKNGVWGLHKLLYRYQSPGSRPRQHRRCPFWTMISSHMIEIMKELHLSASFISLITKKEIMLSLIAFVDDTELFLTHSGNDVKVLVAKASTAIKTWRELLKVTGGAMRPEKCAWTLMRYDTKSKRNQHEIKLPDEEGVEIPIQKI